MRRVTATEAARSFGDILGLVMHGQTVQVLRHGRAVARITPDAEFMSGKTIAALFRGVRPDPEAAQAISEQLRRLRKEEDHALALGH